jgi:hypothetical protein
VTPRAAPRRGPFVGPTHGDKGAVMRLVDGEP